MTLAGLLSRRDYIPATPEILKKESVFSPERFG